MPFKRRAIIGVLHVSAHMAAALILMLLMELGIEMCIRHHLVATSGEKSSQFSWFYFFFSISLEQVWSENGDFIFVEY